MTLFSEFKLLVKRNVLISISVLTIILLSLTALFVDFSINDSSVTTVDPEFRSLLSKATDNKLNSSSVSSKGLIKNGNLKNSLSDAQNIVISSQTVKNVPPVSLPIYFYHYIRNITHDNSLGDRLSVSTDIFENQLLSIIDHGYTSISFQDLLNYVYNGKPLPIKPILLTFDDGYDNMYTNAYPLLLKYNLKASFAIITGLVGRVGYLTWSQIKEMKASGFDMVSHTVNHINLAIASMQRLTYELKESKSTLDKELNQNTLVLVYPSGKYNPDVEKASKDAGYLLARTTNYGINVDPHNPYEVPGIRIMNGFKVI